jgi:hypothetical protein
MASMSDHATSAEELAAYLERLGARVSRDEDGETLGLTLGEGRVAALRWEAGSRAVRFTVPTGLQVPERFRGAALLELARVNDALEAPGLVIDLDDGAVEYRARLLARGDGRLDLDVFRATLHAALACVDRVLPGLRAAFRRTRHSAARSAAAALAGYCE